MISQEEAKAKLEQIGQGQLLHFWGELTPKEQGHLLKDIETLDLNLFAKQRAKLQEAPFSPLVCPPYPAREKGHSEYAQKGRELLQAGKCATVILAGGSGSRLRYPGPKGCFPITAVKKKSLYQRLAEKVCAASKQVRYPLEIAFMTSALNHLITETFFAKHAFFKLSPSQTHFFNQGLWPLLTLEGDLFLENKDKIAFGPNGNGVALQRFYTSAVYERWKKQGVEYINIIPVDNVLADPFDAELIGFHALRGSDFSMRAAFRKDPQEKVGVIVETQGRAKVVEYTELGAQSAAQTPFLANLNLYCLNLDFIEKVQKAELPLHKVKKSAQKMEMHGMPHEVSCWKFEYFLFDYLELASKVSILPSEREEFFAPLKNFEGEDSIISVQAALQEADRKAYFKVTERRLPSQDTFEVAQEFYYPSEELTLRNKNRPQPTQNYIEAL